MNQVITTTICPNQANEAKEEIVTASVQWFTFHRGILHLEGASKLIEKELQALEQDLLAAKWQKALGKEHKSIEKLEQGIRSFSLSQIEVDQMIDALRDKQTRCAESLSEPALALLRECQSVNLPGRLHATWIVTEAIKRCYVRQAHDFR